MSKGTPRTQESKTQAALENYLKVTEDWEQQGGGTFTAPKVTIPHDEGELYNRQQVQPADPRRGHYNRFLTTLEEVAPEVLGELYEVRKNLRATFNEVLLDNVQMQRPIRDLLSVRDNPYGQLPPRTKGVIAWLERHHLIADWMLERARETLVWWDIQAQEGKLDPEKLAFAKYRLDQAPPYSEEDRPAFSLFHQPRTAEPWRIEESYLRWRFEQGLLEYKRAREARYEPMTVSDKNNQHFTWLVRYQVHGMSFRDICVSYPKNGSLEESAVGRALHSTAGLLGLPLRPPAKGGRPAKG